MRILVIFSLGGLVLFCLLRRCDGCLDTLLKSFFQVFNPKVEAGPERLINRHPYEDRIMPEFSVTVDHDVPTADYVEDVDNSVQSRGAVGSSSCSYDDDDDDDNAVVTSGDDQGQLLSDFIISLLETIQLTSRATLKKSKRKIITSATTKTTTSTKTKRRCPDNVWRP